MGTTGGMCRKEAFSMCTDTFSLTCSARFGYGSPRGVAVPNGEFGGGREYPCQVDARTRGRDLPCGVSGVASVAKSACTRLDQL